MREILFRGFHECENGTEIAVVNGKEYKGEWVEGCYVYDNNLNHHIRAFDNCYYAVIPKTVGQYTGFDDKNGKRIFDGYRVKVTTQFDEEFYGEISFRDGSFRIDFCGAVDYLFNQLEIGHQIEVVGTIFDKPDDLGQAFEDEILDASEKI